MIVLFDTDAIINWLAGREAERSLVIIDRHKPGISSISAMEVLEGIREHDIEARRQWEVLLDSSEIFDFDLDTAHIAANIRRELRGRGVRVTHRALDIMIAATAIEYDLNLFTRNTRHFEDIEGLRLWRPNE